MQKQNVTQQGSIDSDDESSATKDIDDSRNEYRDKPNTNFSALLSNLTVELHKKIGGGG